MIKRSRKIKSADAEMLVLSTLPWTCTHFGDQSEIEAFIPATGTWETIADVRSVGNVDAEDLASFIVRATKAFRNQNGSWKQITKVLKSCLNCTVLPEQLKREIDATILSLNEVE